MTAIEVLDLACSVALADPALAYKLAERAMVMSIVGDIHVWRAAWALMDALASNSG